MVEGKIINLGDAPEYELKAMRLIETCFHYESPHSYAVDFFPLIKSANAAHRFLLLNPALELIGHIGVKPKILTHLHFEFQVIFIGGIAVAAEARGKGHFSTLMEHVKTHYGPKVPLMFLWSDKPTIYEKHGFVLCLGQIQVEGKGQNFDLEKSKYRDLNWEDKKRVRELYKKTLEENCFSVKREKEDWQDIESITSADFYLKRNKDRVVAYYVQNKGKDLSGVVHEFGFEEEKYLKEMINMSSATFWLPEKYLALFSFRSSSVW